MFNIAKLMRAESALLTPTLEKAIQSQLDEVVGGHFQASSMSFSFSVPNSLLAWPLID